MEAPPLIVTAIIDPHTFSILDSLRQKHFPSERNFLSAHLTLFHHLPGDEIAAVRDIIEKTTENTLSFDLNFDSLRFLGRGVAFGVVSAELLDLRRGLAAEFARWLKPQDRQKFQPHVTIQNKVEPEEARHLFEHLASDFEPFTGHAEGVAIWHYLGGPWRLETEFRFETRPTPAR